jgi:hypothetical protein
MIALVKEIDVLVCELGVYPADLSAFSLAEGGRLTPAYVPQNMTSAGREEEIAIVAGKV